MIALLDSGPLGVLTSPLANPDAIRCQQWFDRMVEHGHHMLTSEVCDCEVRRELIRINSTTGIARLDAFILLVDFMPINRGTMLRAAQLWADARRRGRPTADPSALDADVILAAHAQLLGELTGDVVVVATTNARHLGQFVDARRWQEIAG